MPETKAWRRKRPWGGVCDGWVVYDEGVGEEIKSGMEGGGEGHPQGLAMGVDQP